MLNFIITSPLAYTQIRLSNPCDLFWNNLKALSPSFYTFNSLFTPVTFQPADRQISLRTGSQTEVIKVNVIWFKGLSRIVEDIIIENKYYWESILVVLIWRGECTFSFENYNGIKYNHLLDSFNMRLRIHILCIRVNPYTYIYPGCLTDGQSDR